MEIKTILLIALAAFASLGLVVFQYYYRSKRKGTNSILLATLRFFSLFGLFILIINPKFSRNEYSIEKTNLIILSDNSTSIKSSAKEVASILNQIKTNTNIAERFKLSQYSFGTTLVENDSLSYDDRNTNISKALSLVNDVYANTSATVVLLSDGNQTIGADYEFQSANSKFPVYPIAVGDTTRYEDLRVGQVNVNKFAFLNNKFPIEAYISYEGRGSVRTAVNILLNGQIAYKETIQFSESNTTKLINTNILAKSVGIKTIEVRVAPLENERLIANNQKKLALEVIDEKTKIGIVSALLHPDIGALTKAIESNEQRTVILLKPKSSPKDLEEIDVFILYQPNQAFNSILDYINQTKASSFIVGGTKTDWRVVNTIHQEMNVEDGYPTQDIVGILNPSFSNFDISNFDMLDFPPLESDAGPIKQSGNIETLIGMQIRGRAMDSPLLYALDNGNQKSIVLLGEHIWKWRMQSHRNTQSFENFDEFLGKLILYLSTNKSKNRLTLEYDRIYDGSKLAKITASYFDETFVFDPNAQLELQLKQVANGASKTIPMLLKGSFYEADISGLSAGDYDFTLSVKDENRSKSGKFTILEFDVEQQFIATDYKKLNQLALATEGQLYFSSEVDSLLHELTNSNQFLPIQKGTKNVVSLIDFRILLALIIATLAIEWFIRKYNGLI